MENERWKLFIVDDQPPILAGLSELFVELDYDVRSAGDGPSALAEISREMPDVLLADLHMPGMSGFELLEVVRRFFPSIRVIAMSGTFSTRSVQPELAADLFYEKGSGISSLVESVESLAQAARSVGVGDGERRSGFQFADLILACRGGGSAEDTPFD